VSEVSKHRAHASRKKRPFSRRLNNPLVMSGSRSWTGSEFHRWEPVLQCNIRCMWLVATRYLFLKVLLWTTHIDMESDCKMLN